MTGSPGTIMRSLKTALQGLDHIELYLFQHDGLYTMSKKNSSQNDYKGALDQIKNNPIAIIIGVGIAVATGTSTIANYYFQKEKNIITTNLQNEMESNKKKFEQRLASIERRLGENEYFDVRNLQIDAQTVNFLSSSTEYFSSDGFYAETGQERWDYNYFDDLELLEFTANKDEPFYQMTTQNAGSQPGTPDSRTDTYMD